MLGLRFAGQKLREFDDAYAARAFNDAANIPIIGMTSAITAGMPLTYRPQFDTAQEIAMQLAEGGHGPARPRDVKFAQGAARAMAAGTMATSAGYRYGLPAAGITLAGKGIYDIATGQDGNGELQM